MILIIGHLAVDLSQGALPAVLPILQARMDLSYAAAGFILMAMSISSSVIQPIFGYLTDRWDMRWMLPAGLVMSGLGFAGLYFADNYIMVLCLVSLAGLGVAIYHPEGMKLTTAVAGSKRVKAVSWFLVGGNLGVALGPAYFSAGHSLLGAHGLLSFALPGLLTAGLFLWFSHDAKKPNLNSAPPKQAVSALPEQQQWVAFGLLCLTVIFRSFTHSGLQAMMPFYIIQELRGSQVEAANFLSTYFFAGVAGTICGPYLSARTGYKNYFVISSLLLCPCLLALLHFDNSFSYLWIALAGFLVMSAWTVMIYMSQLILPHRIGLASGMLLGLSLGMGGVGATLLGSVADWQGLFTALTLTALLPLVPAILGLMIVLPKEEA